MIYKKKIYLLKNKNLIFIKIYFNLCPQFLNHSPKLEAVAASSVIIFGLLSSVSEKLQSHKGKMLSCYSKQTPFYHNWVYDNEGLLASTKDGGWLLGKTTENRGLEFSIPPPDF